MSTKTVPGSSDPRRHLFTRLGATADEVAKNLHELGIAGVPNAVRFLNPIVQYAVRNLEVDALKADVIKGDQLTITLSDWREELIPLPDAVIDFLKRFNGGEYADLVIPVGG